MVSQHTLRHVLTEPKDNFDLRSTATKNTKSEAWPGIEGVHTWDEFNLHTLNESYGHILDAPMAMDPCPMLRTNPEPDHLQITSDPDIRKMVDWNKSVLDATLTHAQEQLELSPGIVVAQSVSTREVPRVPLPGVSVRSGEHGQSVLDHLIKLDDFPVQNLVVGFGRTSKKWNGTSFLQLVNSSALKSGDLPKNISWPVKQLANLCEKANTRYGYIQTDKDVTVFCFSKGQDDQFGVRAMPIPWSRHGTKVLTTDLLSGGCLCWPCPLLRTEN
ncbi:hypothetical protein BGZ63DRAFT_465799 [Mariannaea sp. PMI_226]|nr:hypothetical protein BGZ63DRAFT_465799 [Mariannaea sp. PMI_226]